MVSKISPAAASTALGFQPFIPGQKRPVCHGYHWCCGFYWKGKLLLKYSAWFFNSKKFSSCKHSVAVRQVLWLWGLSVCVPLLQVYPLIWHWSKKCLFESIGFDLPSGELQRSCHIAIPFSPCFMSVYVKCLILPNLRDGGITAYLRHPVIILKLFKMLWLKSFWVRRITEGNWFCSPFLCLLAAWLICSSGLTELCLRLMAHFQIQYNMAARWSMLIK